MKITVIGTGNMGSAFAKQLSSAGHSVRITGRDIEKANVLAAQFANVSAFPAAEALGDSDVVVLGHGLHRRRRSPAKPG
ncbi:MAG: NAD(P)-binding domain-containing protein [Candidatus Pseudomonas colombiensis]|nr:MAG: NAD(P)-binding domain-containing protein [Pseudomonas sp.]